jgi:hypothetical protein
MPNFGLDKCSHNYNFFIYYSMENILYNLDYMPKCSCYDSSSSDDSSDDECYKCRRCEPKRQKKCKSCSRCENKCEKETKKEEKPICKKSGCKKHKQKSCCKDIVPQSDPIDPNAKSGGCIFITIR